MEGSEAVLETPETGLDGAAVEMSDMDILNSADEELGVPAADPASDPAPADEEADKQVPAEGDQKPPAEKPAEDPAKQAEAAKKEAPAVDLPASVKALKESLDKNPVLKAELDKNPNLRNMLYANARRSQELGEFKTHFATLELAKTARVAAEDLGDIESQFFSKSPQGFDALIQRMAERSVLKDANGEPLVDPATGQYRSDGTIDGFFRHHRQTYFWPELEKMAEGASDPDVTAAIGILQEFIGDKKPATDTKRGAGASGVDQNSALPAEVQKRLARLDTLERQQGTQTDSARKQYEGGVVTAVTTDVRTMLEERVKRFAPALSPKLQKRIVDDTFKEIGEIAKKDKLYTADFRRLLQNANNSDEIKKQLVNKAMGYARNVAGPVIQRHVSDFSTEAITINDEKKAKLDIQKARTEPKGAGGTNTPIRQGDIHSMIREGEQLSQKLFGRRLTDKEILDIEDTVPTFQRMQKTRG